LTEKVHGLRGEYAGLNLWWRMNKMGNNGVTITIALGVIAALAAGQGYLLYRIMMLDAAERYSDIPFLLGVTVLIYAVILFIYLRIFIGVKAYKKVVDTH
jgi:hypothetical protein